MKTSHIPLTGSRPAGFNYLVVPANSTIMKPEHRLLRDTLSQANYILNDGSKSLELSIAWDDPRFGRSVMANLMMDEEWKCAHRADGKANEFIPEMFPAPASSPKRGSARRNCVSRLLATGNYS